jgi:hypothetical protein
MPAFGTRLDITLPQTEWPELQAATEGYNRLKAERKATQQRLGGLRHRRERAVEADRVALAQAIREEKPDPGDKTVEKFDKELLACNRRLEALEVALDEAEVELIDVIDRHRNEWLEQAEAKLDSAYETYAEAIETLAAAGDAVAREWGLVRWIKNFPEEEVAYRVRGSYVIGLKATHGDPYSLFQIIEALRADAKRPDPPRVIPWGVAAHEAITGVNPYE